MKFDVTFISFRQWERYRAACEWSRVLDIKVVNVLLK